MGYTYDETVYDVVVTVTDNNSVLVAKWTANDENEIVFTNNYKPEETTLALPVTKKIDGDTAEAKEFRFKLEGKDGAPMPEGDGNVASVVGEGQTEFGSITFVTAGTYNYTVTEENGAEPGYTYDTTLQNVTVTVTDNDGRLSAAYTVANARGDDEIIFNNIYTPTPVSVELGATKVLKNKTLEAQMFSFTLADENGQLLQTVMNDVNGKVAFTAIEYTKAGTYVYTIAEKQESMSGIRYDKTVHTVTVTITDDNGVLVASVDRTSEENVFTNVYKRGGTDVPKTGDGPDRLTAAGLIGLAALAMLMILGKKRKTI